MVVPLHLAIASSENLCSSSPDQEGNLVSIQELMVSLEALS
jgi:hypothetical protein